MNHSGISVRMHDWRRGATLFAFTETRNGRVRDPKMKGSITMTRHTLGKLSSAVAAAAILALGLGNGPAHAQQASTGRYILQLQGYTCTRFVGIDAWVCTKPGAPTYDCVGYVCQPVVSTIVAPPYSPPLNQPPVATAP